MTLVEFLAPLKSASHRERVLAVMYYRHRYDDVDSLTTEQIRNGLKQARAPKWKSINVADLLAKSGALVDSPGRERSEEHTSELQSPCNLVCRLLLEKKKQDKMRHTQA